MYSSRLRGERIREGLAGVVKYALIVLSSSVLTLILQTYFPPMNARLTHAVYRKLLSHTQELPAGEAQRAYRKQLEETLFTLRSDRTVRMVKAEIPNAALNYQRNLAQADADGIVRLQGKSATIPVIAVPRRTKGFLETARITYIDPISLPTQLVASVGLPFTGNTAKDWLLIPDLTAGQGHSFYFQRY